MAQITGCSEESTGWSTLCKHLVHCNPGLRGTAIPREKGCNQLSSHTACFLRRSSNSLKNTETAGLDIKARKQGRLVKGLPSHLIQYSPYQGLSGTPDLVSWERTPTSSQGGKVFKPSSFRLLSSTLILLPPTSSPGRESGLAPQGKQGGALCLISFRLARLKKKKVLETCCMIQLTYALEIPKKA